MAHIEEIRVLNLDRSHDRLIYFRQQNPHLPSIERFAAIDGQKLDRQALIKSGDIASDLPYTLGGLGNAFSHLMQWSDCVKQSKALTILEDDAVLCGNFVEEANRILDSLDSDWDIIMWGHNFDTVMACDLIPGISSSVMIFDQNTMRKALPSFHKRNMQSNAFRVSKLLGIPAYTISPKGAEKLAKLCWPLRSCDVFFPLLGPRSNFSIDFMMNIAYETISAYVAVPALALTANDWAQSTVQDLNNPNGPASASQS